MGPKSRKFVRESMKSVRKPMKFVCKSMLLRAGYHTYGTRTTYARQRRHVELFMVRTTIISTSGGRGVAG